MAAESGDHKLIDGRFQHSFLFVMKEEGVFSDDKDDPGGMTKFGISAKAYPDLDIESLTVQQAKDIYHADYWLRCGCKNLPKDIAHVLFDAAVNIGADRAVKILQSVLRVEEDGIVGKMTFWASQRLPSDLICWEFTKERILYYTKLDHFPKYGRGWISRSMRALRFVLD